MNNFLSKEVNSAKGKAGIYCLLVLSNFFSSPFLFSQTKNNFFQFRNMATEAGILPAASNITGHGAAWGDVDGDGSADLYVGTFMKDGKSNIFFRNSNGKFIKDTQQLLQIPTRSTGIVFSDFDNDGDPDLYIGSMPQPSNLVRGNSLFENKGKGIFLDISSQNGACPIGFGGRSVTVLDFDGDGLLDILAGEDPLPGYNGSATKSSRLFRNQGKLQFEDVSSASGLPSGIPGLGVAASDMNGDGWPDFFLASGKDGNLLFLNDKKGKFYEASGTRRIFEWNGSGGDNMVCGVALGDVNADGMPDVLLGPHFKQPWLEPQPLRLFLNRGMSAGTLQFEEVTALAGLTPLHMKAPHVEIQDFDNDGLMDIYTSIITLNNGNVYPLIFRQKELKNGIPRFEQSALQQTNYPSEEDKTFTGGTTAFIEKVLKEEKIIYAAAGPSCDFDNDGRLDLFLPSWWPEVSSLLLRNETRGGNWLQVHVNDLKYGNRMGIGAKIKLYKVGQLGKDSSLVGWQQINVGFGYASGHMPVAHFGLGKISAVDIEVIFPHNQGIIVQRNVKANQRIVIQ